MARPNATQVRKRFEKRYDLQCLKRCAIPEVRNALDEIEREALRRWENKEPIDTLPLLDAPVRGGGWLSNPVIRSHGLDVQVEDRSPEQPIVSVSLILKVELETLVARPKYPQDLIRPEYVLWEIKRDAPISQILEDVEYQWCQLRTERVRWLGLPEQPKRGASVDRTLRALEMYRRRLEGETWQLIGESLGKAPSTVRGAVRDLCDRSGLPRPEKDTVLPDIPQVDCENCPNRLSPSRPCPGCPKAAYFAKYVPDLEFPLGAD